MDLFKDLPKWALTGAAAIGALAIGAVGTAVGLQLNKHDEKIGDHEIRIVKIETGQFTSADGRELVADIKADLREIKGSITSLQRQVDQINK